MSNLSAYAPDRSVGKQLGSRVYLGREHVDPYVQLGAAILDRARKDAQGKTIDVRTREDVRGALEWARGGRGRITLEAACEMARQSIEFQRRRIREAAST